MHIAITPVRSRPSEREGGREGGREGERESERERARESEREREGERERLCVCVCAKGRLREVGRARKPVHIAITPVRSRPSEREGGRLDKLGGQTCVMLW